MNKVIFFPEHIVFEDKNIHLKLGYAKKDVMVPHKASFKKLDDNKHYFLGDERFELNFTKNIIEKDILYDKFIQIISRAISNYCFVQPLEPKKTRKKGKRTFNSEINYDRNEYINTLFEITNSKENLITISENNQSDVSDSFLIEYRPNNHTILFIWESKSDSAKAAYIFLANNSNYEIIKSRICGYLENSNLKKKRELINKSTKLCKWLSCYYKIQHRNIEQYRYSIENLDQARFEPLKFVESYFNDFMILNGFKSDFLDRFFIYNNNNYLIDNEINFRKKINYRKYRLRDEEEPLTIYIDELHNYLTNHENEPKYIDKKTEIINEIIPYPNLAVNNNFSDINPSVVLSRESKWAVTFLNFKQVNQIEMNTYLFEGARFIEYMESQKKV
jgi:hypothetical protein